VVVAATVHAGAMVVLGGLESFDSRGTCGDPASAAALHDARVAFAVLVGFSALPWLLGAVLAVVRRRPWLRFVLVAVAVSALPVAFWVDALQATPAEWTSSWCF